MSSRFNPRMVVPKTPGLWWVIPPAVGFPIRVFVHRHPRGPRGATIELTANGRRVTALEAIAAGWEWYPSKPDTEPADPEFVAAVARGHRMTGTRAGWNSAAAALRDVVRRASVLPCTCPEPPHAGENEELQAGTSGEMPGSLCLGCSAVDAIAKALAAECDAGALVERRE